MKMKHILTGYFNLPKILEITLCNGYDPVAGETLGLPLGKAEDFKIHEELFQAYKNRFCISWTSKCGAIM